MGKYTNKSSDSYKSGGSNYTYTSGVYTSSGAKVHNVAAYAAAGGKTYTSAGVRINNPVAYQGAIEHSVRQNTDNPKYLYHYTDDKSLASIKSSNTLRGSSDPGDCSLGKGVYFTAKPPRSSSESLLNNNYGTASKNHDRVQSYVRIDADKVNAINGRAKLGRDVHLIPSKNLDLKELGVKYGNR